MLSVNNNKYLIFFHSSPYFFTSFIVPSRASNCKVEHKWWQQGPLTFSYLEQCFLISAPMTFWTEHSRLRAGTLPCALC